MCLHICIYIYVFSYVHIHIYIYIYFFIYVYPFICTNLGVGKATVQRSAQSHLRAATTPNRERAALVVS